MFDNIDSSIMSINHKSPIILTILSNYLLVSRRPDHRFLTTKIIGIDILFFHVM